MYPPRPSSLNVTLKKVIFFVIFFFYIFLPLLLMMWDTLPAGGCDLPCPPQLKCLNNIYCKFFCSMLHPSVNSSTLLKPEHSERLPKLQVPHTLLHLHPRIQMDPRVTVVQQTLLSKGASSKLIPRHLPTLFKSTRHI